MKLICAALIAVSSLAWAQQGPPQGDPMGDHFFPPELIMQNQKSLGLTADQQSAIRAEMQKTMGKFTDLQWQQSAEAEALGELMKQDKPDEKAVLAQFDKLLSIESEVKRLHVGTMVRMKNILTAEQLTKLRDLKRQMRRPSMGGPGGNMPPGA